MTAKDRKNKLKKLGIYTALEEEIYDDIKSAIARLYGIFTQSPIVTKYGFDQEKKELKLVASEYLVKDQEFRPVVYQWGVVTTAHVRKKLCDLRDLMRTKKIKTISGDTDCLNFKGNAKSIISEFNAKVNSMVKRRCQAIGIDPEGLKDLGTLEVEHYKYYRLTAVKQYATVTESDSGDVFEFHCGGLNKSCNYFNDYSKDALQKIKHFRLGLTIPSDDAPRKIVRNCTGTKKISFTDREGNKIRSEVTSYQIEQSMKFTFGDPFSSLVDINDVVMPTESDPDTVIQDTAALLNRVRSTPKNIEKKGKKKK